MATDGSTSVSPLVPSSEVRPVYAWYVVGVLHLATLGLALNVRIFTLVIEPIRSHFGVGDTASGCLLGSALPFLVPSQASFWGV